MTDILTTSGELLESIGVSTRVVADGDRRILVFESPTILGFIFSYETAPQIIERWKRDSDQTIAGHQFGLRRAGQKAWNTYAVFLATGAADRNLSIALSAIEEDLVGTRKIVRAGITDIEDVRAALLPLLPLQNNPSLEAVNFIAEVRQRTTELSPKVVEAFASGVDIPIALQVFEEAP